jgi:3-phenylpropionate/trans-cinnamate dioxygenase ferredoxin component
MEETLGKFVKVARTSEIADQAARVFDIEDRRIALFNLGGRFYALDDACPHEGGPLSEGSIEDEEVECPWHSSRFNLKTGEVTVPPALENVGRYNVRVTGDDIEVEV